MNKKDEDYHLLFKMVKAVTIGEEKGSGEYRGYGFDRSMVFPMSHLAAIEIPEDKAMFRQSNGSGFRTDVDISGNLNKREKNLQRWAAPSGSVVDGPLEKPGEPSGSWDQFKANEQKFGLKTDYDENIYTTSINRNDPLYALREREAARIVREIESSSSSNLHVREERGIDDEIDEETK
jgi:PAB1-binding protein PBP1